MTRARFLMGVGAVLFIFVIDAVAKFLALAHAGPANTSEIPSPVAFALHKNPGIAFDIPVPFFIILPLTLGIIIFFGAHFGRQAFINKRLEEGLACVMICSGALGNFLDRALNGFTTDYLILFRTSAINLADVLIILGMALFLWYHEGNPQVEKNLT